jgi:hypothetical protein
MGNLTQQMPHDAINPALSMASQRLFAKIALSRPSHEHPMTTVSIDADIKAKWHQGQCSYSPGSPEELAIIGIDLLVKELGTEAARAFVSQVFEKYRHTELAKLT